MVEAGRGRRGKPESAYIGCYSKGTEPNPGATPVPPSTLSKDTFGGYYPGGQGDIPDWCDDPRDDTACLEDCDRCQGDCGRCSRDCRDCRDYCEQEPTPPECGEPPFCRGECDCGGACDCDARCNCPQKTPEEMGSPKATTNFGIWVWSEPACTETNRYMLATIKEADADPRACACIKDSLWDGACCGDDGYAAGEPDDPDTKKSFCAECKYTRNALGELVWDAEVKLCCGDDDDDDPDWSETSCLSCQIGNNVGNRDWGPGCCGDDGEDCASLEGGDICHLDSEGGSPSWISSPAERGNIRYLGCSNNEYLADGSTWIGCFGSFWKNTVSNHDYLCTKTGRESILECCGDNACISKTDGKRLATGQSYNGAGGGGGGINGGGGTKPSIFVGWGPANYWDSHIVNTGQADALANTLADNGLNLVLIEYVPGGSEDPDPRIARRNEAKALVDAMRKRNVWTFINIANANGRWLNEEATDEWFIGEVEWIKQNIGINKVILQAGSEWGGDKFRRWADYVAANWPGVKSWNEGARPTSGPPNHYLDYHPCSISDTGPGGGTFIVNSDCSPPINWLNGCDEVGGNVCFGEPADRGRVRDYAKNVLSRGSHFVMYDVEKKSIDMGAILGIADGLRDSGITITGNVVANQIQNPFDESRKYSSNNVGLKSITGAAVAGTTTTGTTYYCRTDSKFVTDLDTPDAQKNDAALNAKNKATCEKAGFKWTGTKCCSEADDANEYYNDHGTIGGCWNSNLVISVDFVKDTSNSVMNYNGEFHGCAIDKANFNKNNDNLLGLADKHTGAPLITNHPYCFNDPEKNYYCSYTEKWLPTDGIDTIHLSFAPISNPNQTAECCAQNECWDGDKCIENQRNKPLAQPIGDGFRCIDGEWVKTNLKFTPDGTVSGYCPKETQCLVNVFGKNETSQCIESGQYIDDNFCENGQWSSRTKLLALKLLKLKSGDFTLFCDNRDNTLNNLQYLTESNEIVANILTNIQTNNFCVLKTGNKIIAATSINKELEEVPSNTLNIFGVTSCDSAFIDDGQYHSCDATNKVWFNKRLKSFIYSASAITIPSEQNLLSLFEEFIYNPIKSIIDSIKRLITTPPFDESYVKGIKKFDKLYISQQGNKAITGTIEGKNFKNVVIEYRNFDTDICELVEQFSQAKKDVSSGISCKKEGNNYYVLVQGSQFTNINPESIWPDLTSKLRLK